jgi:hypothetical protein
MVRVITRILEEVPHISKIGEGHFSSDFDSFSSFEEACGSTQDKSASPSHEQEQEPNQKLSSQNVAADTNAQVEEESQGRNSSSNRPYLHRSLDEMVYREESTIDTVVQLEPTPINLQEGMFHEVERIHLLPDNITRCSEEYITALSHLKYSTPTAEDSQQDESNPPTSTTTSSSLLQHQTDSDSDPSIRIHQYQNERWMERYQDLVEYDRVHGHCNVPHVYRDNPSLGQWVKRQRHQHKLQQQSQHSHLTHDRIQMLEVLGFIWDSHGAAWEKNYQELKEFRNAHGHCNVPCVYQGNPKLSTWIKRQRLQYRLFVANQPSAMTHGRFMKLENLGMVWDFVGNKEKPSMKGLQCKKDF